MPTILLIEDDPTVAELVGDVLRAEGFVVLHEPDGEAGLARLGQSQVDLVLLDMLLPKIQGFDLLSKIRHSPAGEDVPLIVLSGVFKARTYEDDLKKRFEIAAYLDKPVNNDALIDALHDVFSSAYPEPVNRRSMSQVVGHGSLPEISAIPKVSLAADAPGTVPFKGDLVDVSFARLLGALFSARVNGALMLRKGTIKKIVHFQNGLPVFVKSNLLSECLGQVMVNERLISQAQCDESLRRKRDMPGVRQGEILVKMGAISPHNLDYALELQVQHKLYDLFSWLEGKYQFNSKAEYEGSQVVLELGPLALIYEGASRCMSNERIRRDLAYAEGMTLVPSTDPTFRYQALQLEPNADRLLDQLDGSRTLDDLLAQGSLPEAEATLLLHALISGGLVKVVDPFQPVAGPVSSALPVAKAVHPAPPVGGGLRTNKTMEIGEEEVVVLSTGEIDAIAELAKVELRLPPILEEAISSGPPTRVAAPDPRPDPQPPPPPDVDEDEEPTFPPKRPGPPRVEPILAVPERPRLEPQSSMIPRAQNWGGKKERTSTDDLPSTAPSMSEDLRLQIRARLEAQMDKLASHKPSPVPKDRMATGLAPPPKKANKLQSSSLRVGIDLQKERERTEVELQLRLSELEELSCYQLLGLTPGATTDQIRLAYQNESRKHDPERILPGGASHEARRSAEQIYLLLTRALHTLTNPEARAQYDLRHGVTQLPTPASPLLAGAAAEAGLAALSAGDPATARDRFLEATRLDPIDALYAAHLAWSTYLMAPDDAQVVAKVQDTLAKAVERAPNSDVAHRYTGLVAQKVGKREDALHFLNRAVLLNPDDVAALRALKELEPKPAKKQGLLSRLTLGGS